MRRALVSCLLIALLGGSSALLAARERPAMAEATADATPAADDDDDASPASEPASPPPKRAAGPAAIARGPVGLRVVASSWELVTPGIVMNRGAEPAPGSQFDAAGLRVSFAAAADTAGLEARLGRGGDVADGADLALMPLPTFIASYERLRALSPQVFFVIGWSRGADVLTGDAAVLQRGVPGKARFVLDAHRGSAEGMLGLFALAHAGVPSSRVEFGDAHAASLHARVRRRSGEIDARDVVLSTADAVHLVPIVAVAARGTLTSKRDALVEFVRVWQAGTRQLALDPAGATRLVAAQVGAPEAVDLIDALGWLEFSDLGEAAAASGLAGRRAARLDVLFGDGWSLLRDAGVVATPAPEQPPVSAVVMAALVAAERGHGESTHVAAHRWSPTPAKARALLTRRFDDVLSSREGEAKLVRELGLLADVFARSRIRITVPKDTAIAKDLVARTTERFGLQREQFEVRRARTGGATATVEVMPPA